MVFTASDFNDLKQLLVAHPEWRAELRELLLTEDFLALPAIVRELVEAQRRTEQRVAELAEAQRRTDQRVAELAEALRELAEAQRRTDQRLAELAEAQQRLEVRMDRVETRLDGVETRLDRVETRLDGVETRLDRVEVRLSRLQGDNLENRYRQRAGAYFGRWLRGTKVVEDNEVLDRVGSQLSAEELSDLLLTDLIVRGRIAQRPERPEVWLAVEVSAVVDRNDVARAVRRAELLRRVGLPGLPVVAGEDMTEGAQTAARDLAVALFQNGSVQLWDEALAAWLA